MGDEDVANFTLAHKHGAPSNSRPGRFVNAPPAMPCIFPYISAMLELFHGRRTDKDVIDKLGRRGYSASDRESKEVLDFLASKGVLSKDRMDYAGGVLSMIKPGGRRPVCEKCGKRCVVLLYSKR